MVDDVRSGPGVIGTLAQVARSHPPGEYGMVLAIGYSNLPGRWAAWQRVRELGYALPALIHPRAYVADSACVEEGAMIMAGAIVDVRAVIGEAAVLWPGACVNHDAAIGANAFVSPKATVCGFAEVGAHSFIGAGAAVVDHARVPEGSFVKMLGRWTRRQT